MLWASWTRLSQLTLPPCLCGPQNNVLKMVFLESICAICKVDNNKALCKKLAVFCRENKLAKKVKVRG